MQLSPVRAIRLALVAGLTVCAVPAHVSARSAPLQVGTLSAAEALALATAYRAVLAQPAVRAASEAAIRQQLRTARPVALFKGTWAIPLDLSSVYAAPAVQAALAVRLAGTPLAGRLTAALQNRAAQNASAFLGVGFVGATVVATLGAAGIQQAEAAVRGSLQGVQAVLGAVTDDYVAKVVVYVGVPSLSQLGTAAGQGVAALWNWATSGGSSTGTANTGTQIDDPNADPDGDGVPNRLDGDDDGDGVTDDKDAYPYDKDQSICDCLGGAFVWGLTNLNSIAVSQVLVAAYTEIGTEARSGRITNVALSGVAVRVAFSAQVH